jgi:hypothetical protein
LNAYVRVSFSNEDLEGKSLYSLIKLYQSDKSLHEYTQDFNSSYSYSKDDISVKVASYLYIGGLGMAHFELILCQIGRLANAPL